MDGEGGGSWGGGGGTEMTRRGGEGGGGGGAGHSQTTKNKSMHRKCQQLIEMQSSVLLSPNSPERSTSDTCTKTVLIPTRRCTQSYP